MHPSRSRHPALLLAPLAVVTCVVAGCSPGPGVEQAAPGTAPAGGAAERARCVVADPEGELVLQVTTVHAPTGGLLVDDVSVAGGLNLEVVDAVAVPFAGTPGTQGVVLDYPPRDNAGLADGLAQWEQRRPLLGLGLRPRDGEQALLVALRLGDPTSLGHLTGTYVVTRGADGTSLAEHAQPLLVKPHDEPCRVDDPDETADW